MPLIKKRKRPPTMLTDGAMAVWNTSWKRSRARLAGALSSTEPLRYSAYAAFRQLGDVGRDSACLMAPASKDRFVRGHSFSIRIRWRMVSRMRGQALTICSNTRRATLSPRDVSKRRSAHQIDRRRASCREGRPGKLDAPSGLSQSSRR